MRSGHDTRHDGRRAGRAKATRTETRIETRIQSQARLETRRRRLGWGRTRMSAADTDTSLQSVTARTSTSTPHSPPHLQPPPPPTPHGPPAFRRCDSDRVVCTSARHGPCHWVTWLHNRSRDPGRATTSPDKHGRRRTAVVRQCLLLAVTALVT